ncbi:hypothetical protein ARMA_0415 [Ardenticatena maritima]|uniref:Uncharacterized protein n=1 Tax=Ardenticatena maritima TaxID=872965 RepID=A0A0M8K6Y4_9CHLR|nr:hypothetical protein ARMA_0415 [Ardenticatena maritima]
MAANIAISALIFNFLIEKYPKNKLFVDRELCFSYNET